MPKGLEIPGYKPPSGVELMMAMNQQQSITNVLVEALVRFHLRGLTDVAEKREVRFLADTVGLRLTGYEDIYAELDKENADLAEVTRAMSGPPSEETPDA